MMGAYPIQKYPTKTDGTTPPDMMAGLAVIAVMLGIVLFIFLKRNRPDAGKG